MGNGIPPISLISEDMSEREGEGEKPQTNQEENKRAKQEQSREENFGG